MLDQTQLPMLHLDQYLYQLTGLTVGNIKLTLEQPTNWMRSAFPTGKPLEAPYPTHGRLQINLEFETYNKLEGQQKYLCKAVCVYGEETKGLFKYALGG